MREVDLSKYNSRTDLVVDLIKDKPSYETINTINGIKISNIVLDEEKAKFLLKGVGNYTTIYFEDITDTTNYNNVLEVFSSELSKMLVNTKIKKEYSCMVIGLGNEKSVADSLGVLSAKKVTVTKHIYDLVGSLEDGYRVCSCLIPGVMGTTGIETSDIISSVISKVLPDFIIVIDSLASDSIDRLLKTIQITNTGIKPGSGIGNTRKEVSKELYGVPVIAIGVPTVVEASTIVNDTLNYMKKHFSYNILNKNKVLDKLIPSNKINYLNDNPYTLSEEETSLYLGLIGNLNNFEKKVLIKDVLNPIGYNLVVTPKEIDFSIEKLINLISDGINKSIHNISTKN